MEVIYQHLKGKKKREVLMMEDEMIYTEIYKRTRD